MHFIILCVVIPIGYLLKITNGMIVLAQIELHLQASRASHMAFIAARPPLQPYTHKHKYALTLLHAHVMCMRHSLGGMSLMWRRLRSSFYASNYQHKR